MSYGSMLPLYMISALGSTMQDKTLSVATGKIAKPVSMDGNKAKPKNKRRIAKVEMQANVDALNANKLSHQKTTRNPKKLRKLKRKAMSTKLNTVNVVELADGVLQSIDSFPDNEQGNKEAKALFIAKAAENGFDKDDEELVTERLDEGWWDNGGYYIAISHSMKGV